MKLRTGGPRDRIDWKAERDRVDLAAVVTRLLGPAPGRRGDRGLWWSCPLHADPNPSFHVYRDKQGAWRWRCYGCGEYGDAPALLMKMKGMTFPEAVAYLTGGPTPSGPSHPRRCPESKVVQPPGGRGTLDSGLPRPEGMPPADALALVESAAARLWTPEGADALAYLRGPRGLSPETIRAARLGWTPRADGFPWRPPGIVIPWFVGGAVALVKVRPDDAWRDALPEGRRPPKYLAPRGWPVPTALYPSPEAVRPGRPVVLTEGEFDALLLGQALGDRAAVVTLGSASGRPDSGIRAALSAAAPWYIATDNDEAGDRAAASWDGYARVRRVRPPEPFKDWTEAATSPEGTRGCGVDLSRWWSDVLAGIDAPETFTWPELAAWRWGPAVGDPTPGIDATGPNVSLC